jgi:parvulin-like peptidyl-prolyl isomerase
MRRGMSFALVAVALLLGSAALVGAQEVIDRIAARIENDIILRSDVEDLGRYQELVEGKSESKEQLLDRLIDQWIVRTEAEASRFPHPTDAEIDRGVEKVRKSFRSTQDYEEQRKKCGLSDSDVRKIVASQLYLSNYLDTRFRPSVQVSEKDVEAFYQSMVVPRAKARGQQPPTLEASRDIIQEALVEQGINEQADRWLKESRARLHVEKFPEAGLK